MLLLLLLPLLQTWLQEYTDIRARMHQLSSDTMEASITELRRLVSRGNGAELFGGSRVAWYILAMSVVVSQTVRALDCATVQLWHCVLTGSAYRSAHDTNALKADPHNPFCCSMVACRYQSCGSWLQPLVVTTLYQKSQNAS